MTRPEISNQRITAKFSFGKLEDFFFATVFLQSLLIAWFIFLIANAQGETLPLFRLLLGIAILFAILFPAFILLEGFRYSSILAAFFIPLALYTLMFPLFGSLIYHLNMFLDPSIVIPAITGGIGFGLIGLAAYHSRTGILKSFYPGDCRPYHYLPEFSNDTWGIPLRDHRQIHLVSSVYHIARFFFFWVLSFSEETRHITGRMKTNIPCRGEKGVMKNPFHIMIIPTLGCPGRCKYCWSSEEGSPVMTIDTVKDVVAWLKNFRSDRVTFTFHGGEPLLAGVDFYRQALPMLSRELEELTPDFAMQTNLWRMTPEIASVLAEYHVPLGSSIDGPEDITDSQRGEGYYAKCMKGYEIATAAGLQVRFICTFTNKSVKHCEEIFNFFKKMGFPLKLHPALPSLRSENPKEWALEPKEYGDLLVYLLDKALEHIGQMEVMNINDLCRCVFTRRGSVCTFVNCMGNTFAIGPDGSIYPCYRFVGMPEWVMGNVRDRPAIDQLMQSEPGMRMNEFSKYVDTACKDCAHIRYCRGGCPYNAIAPSGGSLDGVDPHCVAYKRIFDELNERLNKEMFEEPGPGMTGIGVPDLRKPKKPGVMALMRSMVSR